MDVQLLQKIEAAKMIWRFKRIARENFVDQAIKKT
jgi:hypothetical protein